MKLYGIKQCDTVRKAKKWLEMHECSFQFFDYRSDNFNKDLIDYLLDHIGKEILLNRRSTTYKNLSEDNKKELETEDGFYKLVLSQPTLLKRPLLEISKGWLIGFKEKEYAESIL